jgi:6-phospho-beta-glucosidase
MNDKVKLAVLGGSGVATPGLIEALTGIPGRKTPIELVLVGRSEEKLALVAGASRLVAGDDPLLSIQHTTQVEEALNGCSYVLNQVRVGGLAARVYDESFPNELGIPGEETVGAGGFANASRTIPVVLEYARMIERICPQANHRAL